MAPDVIPAPVLVVVNPPEDPRTELAANAFLARYQTRTRDAYRHDLTCFFRWCTSIGIQPLEVTRPHFEVWLRWMEEVKGYKAATISRRFGTVALMFRYAVIDELLDKDPTVHVRRVNVDREAQTRTYLNALEYAAVLTVATKNGPRDEAVIAMLGMLGLRVGELCAANVEDLGISRAYETLTVIGKGNRQALLPLPIPVLRPLRNAIGDRTSGPLLLNRDGSRLTRAAVSRILNRCAASAGVTHPITPHGLRRTFITTGLANGVSLRDMQLAARHVDPRTTMVYDRDKQNLDRHANHRVAGILAGMAS